MRAPQMLSQGSTAINMTPMIDVVFLLIIFFLVSSHLARQENSIPLALPEAGSGLEETTEPPPTVVVNVLADGTWQVGGQSRDLPAVEAILRQQFQEAAGLMRLKIRTDATVSYGRLQPLLRAASQVGVVDIVFSVFQESAS